MTTNNYLLFIFLLLPSIVYSSTESEIETKTDQPPPKDKVILDFESHTEAIINNFTYLFPNYIFYSSEFELENPDWKSQFEFTRIVSFHNQNANEHMFTLKIIYNKDNKKTEFHIIDTKVSDIQIPMGELNWDMFQYQLPQYQTMITQSLKYNKFWKRKKMHFYTIEHVLESLKKGLHPVELVDMTNYGGSDQLPSQFDFQLKSKESVFGHISISIQEEKEDTFVGSLSLEQNFMLKVHLKIESRNEVKTFSFQTPVIDSVEARFKSFLSKIFTEIDSTNQFNNINQLVEYIKNYYKLRIPKMTFSEPIQPTSYLQNPDQRDSPSEVVLPIKFEFFSKSLRVLSLMSESGLMEYYLEVSDGFNSFNSPSLSVKFLRCSESLLGSVLDSNKANKLFKTIYEDIMDMFESEYEVIRNRIRNGKTKKDLGQLTKYVENNNLFSKSGSGVSNAEFKIHYSKTEKGKRDFVYLTLTAPSVDCSFQRTFFMDKYNRNNIHDLIKLFFESYWGMSEA
jgi:hypothetical protein